MADKTITLGLAVLIRGLPEWVVEPVNSTHPPIIARVTMSIRKLFPGTQVALLGCAVLALAATGCQTTIGGQTLPSAHYLQDDIQYYPMGPEFRLSRQAEALENYKVQQKGFGDAGNPGQAAPAPAM